MKKVNLLFFAILFLVSLNVMSQKVANTLNNETYKAQATINGVTNTVNTVGAAAETAKGIGNLLKLGKGKKKKAANDAETPDAQSVAIVSAARVTVTTVSFNKIDYMAMKQIKDELLKDTLIKDIKINYNTDNKNFLLIQHTSNIDKISEAILNKWGNKYEVVSIGADEVVFKGK